jgi:hypothetical protein
VFGASEVDATGVIKVLAIPSAFKTVLASFIHSRKLVPSALRGANSNDCILFSRKVGLVDMICTLGIMLAISRSNQERIYILKCLIDMMRRYMRGYLQGMMSKYMRSTDRY